MAALIDGSPYPGQSLASRSGHGYLSILSSPTNSVADARSATTREGHVCLSAGASRIIAVVSCVPGCDKKRGRSGEENKQP